MGKNKLPVSAIILAKNEEETIEECLESLYWADEIIVLDDESTDKTPLICKKYTPHVISRKMHIEGEQRNFGFNRAKNEWIFSIDADERVTKKLVDQITDFLNNPLLTKHYKALSIPIKTYIGDHWLRYGGWYPANKIRLFKKGSFYYDNQKVHPRGFFTGNAYYITGEILHYSYKNFHDYFASLNRQTTFEAEKLFKKGKKLSYVTMARKMIDRFFKAYIIKQGYKGGFLGFCISFINTLYQFQSHLKYWEILEKQKREKKVD
ncbi:glycosyltransferase family 2 protein [Chlamydiota bacterium]